MGSDHEIAKQAKTKELIAEVRNQAQLGAAYAIGKIDVKHTTINRRLETEIRENNHIYHDCVNTPAAERLLDDARGNRAVGSIETVVPVESGGSGSP